jgi:enoyl-CoA hydratase
MKMVLAGEFISAHEALAAGLVAEVAADADCLPRARALAANIAAKAPLAVRLAKEAVLQAFETPLSAGLAAERRNFVILAGTADRREGIAAFLEKRNADFTGT